MSPTAVELVPNPRAPRPKAALRKPLARVAVPIAVASSPTASEPAPKAAALFALGVCYFWPTMIGFTSEYTSKTGALGMSLMGGAGMFATSIWNPIIGSRLDDEKATAMASGLQGAVADVAAGKAVLSFMVYFPLTLVLLFGILFLLRKKIEQQRIVQAH